MKTTAPLLLGLSLATSCFAALSSLQGCGGTSSGQPDAGAGGSATTTSTTGTGGSGGAPVVFIPPDVCKLVGAGNEVPLTDPKAQGQCIFLYDTFGTEALDSWPPTDFMLNLIKSEPAVFGAQFETFGFLPDPNDDLPIGFKRGTNDRTRVRETCAACHVAELPDGKLWFGAPNRKLDFGRFRVEVNKRWVAAGHAPLLTSLEEEKSKALGPGRTDAASSTYPIPVPADFPPYFTLGQRTHLNYIGTGSNLRTEVYFSIYSAGAGSPNEAMAKVPFPADDRVDAFLGFFGAMAPPPAPAQDAALVAAGKAVFAAEKCGSCHHPQDIGLDEVVTYDKDPNGKERLPGEDAAFPRGSIRTDIFHRVLIDDSIVPDGGLPDAGTSDGGADTGYLDLINFIITHGLSVGQTDGYRTNDLRGLWFTSPYLHNGAVPTLEDLLKPASQRPATWMRDGFLIDTAQQGNGNQGHEFGTSLSDADRAALVAYLKSL